MKNIVNFAIETINFKSIIIKKLLILILFFIVCTHLNAQVRGEYYFAQKWLVDFNLPVGLVNQQSFATYTPNYTNALNSQFGNIKFSNGVSFGGDLEFGCYFGKAKVYGIGTGIILQNIYSQINLDNFHVEYQNYDNINIIFRQVITATHPITEKLQNTIINLPIVFRMKQPLNKKSGYSLDAGIIINLYNNTNYSTNANFDYEAIYAYTLKAHDAFTHIYDNNPTPMTSDWLITQQEFNSHNTNPSDNVQKYFDSLSARGYKVGLALAPGQNTGNTSFPAASMGFIVRPAMNIKIYQRLYCYVGAYVTYQIFNNTPSANYRLTDNTAANYNSLVGTLTKINNLSYGANIGIRIFMGHSNIYIPTEDR